MAIRNNFVPGEVLLAADLNDTFGSKLDVAGGKVLQIVRTTDATQRTTTSTSFVDVTGMSVTITPQKDNSAILLIAVGFLATVWSTGDDGLGVLRIADASNNPISGAGFTRFGTFNLQGTSTKQAESGFTLIGRDTPATFSATTYKLRFQSNSANTTTRLNNDLQAGQMYAIEVSA
jgi:hypothetical protein